MIGSLLSAAFVLCVYMVSVGFLLTHNDPERWGVAMTILVPIVLLLFSRLTDSDQRRKVELITGKRMLAGGIGCGLVTLIVAAVMPQLASAVIMYVVAWGTLGTVTKPNGEGKYPAAIIIAGSGDIDRDGTILSMNIKTNIYKNLAHLIAKRGLVTLRYDKRMSLLTTQLSS